MAPSDPRTRANERFMQVVGQDWTDLIIAGLSFTSADRRRYLTPLGEKMGSQDTIHLNNKQRELVDALLDAALAEQYARIEAKYSDGTPESIMRIMGNNDLVVDFQEAVINRFIIALAFLKKAEVPAAKGVFLNLELFHQHFLGSVERVLMGKETAV